jgi:5'-deoxynucleotidase
MKIREILRSAHTRRWNIVRTFRDQNVAEHQYLVTMIARDMAKIVGIRPSDVVLLTEWCLMHDTPEALTGDLPTGTKKAIRLHINFDEIEDSTSQDYARLRKSIHGTAIEIVAKLADLMEGIVFLQNEGVRADVPTTHSYQVLSGCIRAYRTKVKEAMASNPEYPWHLLYNYLEELNESPVQHLSRVYHADLI